MYPIGTIGITYNMDSGIPMGIPSQIRCMTGDPDNREYYIKSDDKYCWIKEEDFKPKEELEISWIRVMNTVNQLRRSENESN